METTCHGIGASRAFGPDCAWLRSHFTAEGVSFRGFTHNFPGISRPAVHQQTFLLFGLILADGDATTGAANTRWVAQHLHVDPWALVVIDTHAISYDSVLPVLFVARGARPQTYCMTTDAMIVQAWVIGGGQETAPLLLLLVCDQVAGAAALDSFVSKTQTCAT